MVYWLIEFEFIDLFINLLIYWLIDILVDYLMVLIDLLWGNNKFLDK